MLNSPIFRIFVEWGLGVLGFLLPSLISLANDKFIDDIQIKAIFSVISYLVGAIFLAITIYLNRDSAKKEVVIQKNEEIDKANQVIGDLQDEINLLNRKHDAYCRGYAFRDPRKESIAALNDVRLFTEVESNIVNVGIFIGVQIDDLNKNKKFDLSVYDFIEFFMKHDDLDVFSDEHQFSKRASFDELRKKFKELIKDDNLDKKNEFNSKEQLFSNDVIRNVIRGVLK